MDSMVPEGKFQRDLPVLWIHPGGAGKQLHDVDARRITVGGRGIGAIVALHAALIWGRASGVVCMDMLSHYGALTESFPTPAQ